MNLHQSSVAPRGRRVIAQAGLLLASLSLSIAAAYAAPVFDKPDADFNGRIFSAGALPGAEAQLMGRSFTPGQVVTLYRGGEALNNGEKYTVTEKGTFEAKVAIPADAVAGVHPIVASVANPYAATVFDLKVTAEVPLSNEANYTLTSEKLVQGLYQSAYSPKTNRLFVTSAVGRPPVKDSRLLKLNADTLAKEAEITVAAADGRKDGHLNAVYGVAVDDANGNVWTTNTRSNTIAVYKQSDLKLVKQFEDGAATHARDVIIDEGLNKAFVSTPGQNTVEVFDTKSLEHVATVTIDSASEKKVSTMSLAIDPEAARVYTVSGSTNELIVIDAKKNAVVKVIAIPGIKGAAGVAVDPKQQRAYVTAQGSDHLVIVDLRSDKVLHTVTVGGGALNVAFDPVSGNAFVANRTGGTLTVVNGEGKIVANLPGGTLPNHVAVDGKGDVFLINKSRGADDAQGDRITRVVPKK